MQRPTFSPKSKARKRVVSFAAFIFMSLMILVSEIAVPHRAFAVFRQSGPVAVNPCSTITTPYTFHAGNIDAFALPPDSASPSAAIQALFPGALGWKSFDDHTSDRFFGHTFANLPANIIKAVLEIRMKPGDGLPFNDSMRLDFAPNNPQVPWGIFLADLPANTSHTWNPGQPAQTFTLNLSSLPPSPNRPTNILGTLAAKRYLDVVVQDDTIVDYVALRVWTCPGPSLFGGLLYANLGQALINRDARGNLVVSNFGSRGDDGVEISLGEAAGFNFHWDLDDASIPVGAFLETRRFGVIDGVPNQLISSIRNTKEGDSMLLSADYSALGATAYELKLYLSGNLVESRTVIANGGSGSTPLLRTPSWIRDSHGVICIDGVGYLGDGYTIGCGDECEPPATCGFEIVTYGGVPTLIGSHLVDAVAIKLVTPATHTTTLNSVQFVGALIPRITFTDASISAFGKPHHALGAATLEAFAGGLAIGNIGSSGDDGVSIDLDKAESFNLTLDPLDAQGAARSASFIQAATTGSRGGGPDQPLGSVKVTRTGPRYHITADFSAIGSSTQRIQVYAGGALIADLSGQRGPVGIVSGWPRKLGATGGELEGFTMDFQPGTTLRINGRVLLVDHLRVLAENVSGAIDFKSAVTLRAAGLDEFTLTGAQVNRIR